MMRAVPSVRMLETGTPPKLAPADRRCVGCDALLSRHNFTSACQFCTRRAQRLQVRCDELPTHPIEGRA
jgi:hypothetical protein